MVAASRTVRGTLRRLEIWLLGPDGNDDLFTYSINTIRIEADSRSKVEWRIRPVMGSGEYKFNTMVSRSDCGNSVRVSASWFDIIN